MVEAGEIKSTQPVAFDTSTMQKETRSGWASSDKHENLADLERPLSPELELRSHGYTTVPRKIAVAPGDSRARPRRYERVFMM
jgi:hypothetical protein